MRRYLAGFGPASRKDVASFTGFALRPLDAILRRLELRRFASEDGEELLDVPDGLLPDPDDAGAAALPADLGREPARPTRAAPACSPRSTARSCSARSTPQSFPTFLVDGAVAGTWRHAEGEIVLEPFAPLAPDDEAALRDEAIGLAALHA